MTPLLIAFVLTFIGLGLIAWARFNPRWQGQDSYDSMGPYVIGLLLIVVAAVLMLGGVFIGIVREVFEYEQTLVDQQNPVVQRPGSGTGST